MKTAIGLKSDQEATRCGVIRYDAAETPMPHWRCFLSFAFFNLFYCSEAFSCGKSVTNAFAIGCATSYVVKRRPCFVSGQEQSYDSGEELTKMHHVLSWNIYRIVEDS